MGEMQACAFTGHRTLPYGEIEAIRGLIDRAIRYAYAQGCRTFYNGGAIGFDIETAERVLALRSEYPDVRLCFLLPCKNQDAKWSAEQKRRYKNALSLAYSVEYIRDVYTENCMRERNEELVRRADMLISYLSHFRSGAYQTVAMAKRKGIPVYNLFNKE